jgi:hypothetical protein
MEAQSTSAGKAWNDCVQDQFTPADIPQLMAKDSTPTACEWERTAPFQALYYTPLTKAEAFGNI